MLKITKMNKDELLPASLIALAPLHREATKAPSVVAIGARICPSACAPSNNSGPASPIGIFAVPMGCSMFPCKDSVVMD